MKVKIFDYKKEQFFEVDLQLLTAKKLIGAGYIQAKLTKRLLTLAFKEIQEKFLQKEARYNGKPDKRFKSTKQ